MALGIKINLKHESSSGRVHIRESSSSIYKWFIFILFYYYYFLTSRDGPSGEALVLEVYILITRFKVQYLFGAFNPLRPSDCRNLIASWITWGVLTRNYLPRACAPSGLVETNASNTRCQSGAKLEIYFRVDWNIK